MPLLKKDGMLYRRLGNSDLEVSCIALGCFSFGGDKGTGSHLGTQMVSLHAGVWGSQDQADTNAAVKKALDVGINFFDNAEMYGDGAAEEALGIALEQSGYTRDQYAIASKVSESYLDPALIKERLEGTLRRLKTDYVDLYQIHWHSRAAVKSSQYPERPLEKEVPLEDTLACLSELQKAGKIRHIGVCNFGPKDMAHVRRIGVPVVSDQVCYSLLWRAPEFHLLPALRESGVSLLSWGSLQQGLLTGKFATADEVPPGRQRTRHFSSKRPQQRHGEDGCEEVTFSAIRALKEVSDEHNIPMAQ
eukprot:Sspe_Gene.106527::Locus_84596_Transcript_2_2_Confidence_0.500_Length_965::g.106527::m.106527